MAIYADAPAAAGFAALLLAAPLLQPQILAFAAARHAAGGATARGAAAGVAAWLGVEWAFPKLFGDTLGHGLVASAWLRQGADLAGAPGLTLALLVSNEALRAALRAGRARPRAALAGAAAAASVAAALAGYGAWRLADLETALAGAPRVRVAAVQAGIARYGRLAAELGTFDAADAIVGSHVALTGEALAGEGVDLLLWPETVYPTTFGAPKSEAGAAFDRAIAGVVAASGVPLVFGAYDVDPDGSEYNAAFFLERDGEGRVGFDTYRKAALFPLTERVPRWLEPLRGALPWLGTWKPGAGTGVVPIALAGGELRAAPLICYDAVDPALAREAVRRGAELLVTLSNDSWFPGGAHLHLAVSIFRTLETRRAQARVTNTGITALILPSGEVVARAGVGERGVVVGALPRVRDLTPLALRVGDPLGPPALALALTLALRFSRRGRSTPLSKGTPLRQRRT